MNIWLEAIRKQIRFNYNGKISTEDLFELDIKSLQDVYSMYSKAYKDYTEDQLDPSILANEAEEAFLRKEIIRAVYSIRLSEQMALQNAQEKEATRQELLSIMADKQKEELKNLSMEELQERLDSL